MISKAIESDKEQITYITARTGVFSQEEIETVPILFDEYLEYGADNDAYKFIVYRDGDKVLGFACYGIRDLADGVYDLFWIAVDPGVHQKGVGRALINATEAAVRELGGRIIIAETSGPTEYESTRKFYVKVGFVNEATIKDFYRSGDDLKIFTKRI